MIMNKAATIPEAIPRKPDTIAAPSAALNGGDKPSDCAKSAIECGNASAASEYHGSAAASTTPATKQMKHNRPRLHAPNATTMKSSRPPCFSAERTRLGNWRLSAAQAESFVKTNCQDLLPR